MSRQEISMGDAKMQCPDHGQEQRCPGKSEKEAFQERGWLVPSIHSLAVKLSFSEVSRISPVFQSPGL